MTMRVLLILLVMTAVGCRASNDLGKPDASPGPSTAAASREITGKVLRVREVRERAGDGAPESVWWRTSDQLPRLPRLIVDATLDVGKNSRVAWICVQSAQCADSEGKNLISGMLKNDEGRVDGELLLESVCPLDHEPAFRWFLDVPGRSARTVSGTLLLQVGIASGVEKVRLLTTHEWTPLDHPSFKAWGAEYRVTQSAVTGASQVEFRPVKAIEAIYRVDPRVTPRGQREGPNLRDSNGASYRVDQSWFPDEPLSVTVFKDVWTGTVRLKLEDELLP